MFGALDIYAAEPGAFGVEEVTLLTELAGDLGFGIMSLRTRSARARAEAEIRSLNADLERRVLTRTAELQTANKLKDELLVRERAAVVELANAQRREAQTGFKIRVGAERLVVRGNENGQPLFGNRRRSKSKMKAPAAPGRLLAKQCLAGSRLGCSPPCCGSPEVPRHAFHLEGTRPAVAAPDG